MVKFGTCKIDLICLARNYKILSGSTQLSMKFVLLIKLKLLAIANFFLRNTAEHKISLLINMKMPTIFGILFQFILLKYSLKFKF